MLDALVHAGVEVCDGWPDGVDPAASRASFSLLVAAPCRLPGRSYVRDVDVLLCPVSVATAPAHDTRAVADRTIDGDHGPRFEDDTVLTFAELPADLVGGFEPPPDALRVAAPG